MTKINLNKLETLAPSHIDKSKSKESIIEQKEKLLQWQQKLIANPKKSVLIVLQGMDASGKDGIIRDVFTGLNPSSCQVANFKKPTEIELAHDFLWRVHALVPQLGHITIFNRSHYEDVLIQKVHNWVDIHTIEQRYQQINDFERMLTENNTLILKYYLHVSKEKQLERLEERASNPDESYKYNENDLKERAYWDDYRDAYHLVFNNCNLIPWKIIPADQNWYKAFLIITDVVKQLKKVEF